MSGVALLEKNSQIEIRGGELEEIPVIFLPYLENAKEVEIVRPTVKDPVLKVDGKVVGAWITL